MFQALPALHLHPLCPFGPTGPGPAAEPLSPSARPVYKAQVRFQTSSWEFLMPETFVLLLSQSLGDVTAWEGRPCP